MIISFMWIIYEIIEKIITSPTSICKMRTFFKVLINKYETQKKEFEKKLQNIKREEKKSEIQ